MKIKMGLLLHLELFVQQFTRIEVQQIMFGSTAKNYCSTNYLEQSYYFMQQ